jgi:hypothetical protein
MVQEWVLPVSNIAWSGSRLLTKRVLFPYSVYISMVYAFPGESPTNVNMARSLSIMKLIVVLSG